MKILLFLGGLRPPKPSPRAGYFLGGLRPPKPSPRAGYFLGGLRPPKPSRTRPIFTSGETGITRSLFRIPCLPFSFFKPQTSGGVG